MSAVTSAARRDEDRNLEPSTEQVVAHVRDLIRVAARCGRATACRPSASWRRRSASAGPPCAPACARSRRWASCSSRHGSGTYIPEGPPTLGIEPLSFLAALHGFTREEMYEARRILEVGAAGLAAERATPEQIATLAEEVASLFASMEDPQRVPGPRHQLPSRGRRRVRQSDRRVARRDGLGALLRAPAARRRRAPASATCATPPRCTGGSIRRSARTMPTTARRR